MFAKLGPDTGYDCISNYTPSDQLADFLNSIQETCGSPKTILYSLNPIDNTMIDTVMGCFQEAPTAGKILERLRLVVQRQRGRHARAAHGFG